MSTPDVKTGAAKLARIIRLYVGQQLGPLSARVKALENRPAASMDGEIHLYLHRHAQAVAGLEARVKSLQAKLGPSK